MVYAILPSARISRPSNVLVTGVPLHSLSVPARMRSRTASISRWVAKCSRVRFSGHARISSNDVLNPGGTTGCSGRDRPHPVKNVKRTALMMAKRLPRIVIGEWSCHGVRVLGDIATKRLDQPKARRRKSEPHDRFLADEWQ